MDPEGGLSILGMYEFLAHEGGLLGIGCGPVEVPKCMRIGV